MDHDPSEWVHIDTLAIWEDELQAERRFRRRVAAWLGLSPGASIGMVLRAMGDDEAEAEEKT